MRRVTSRPSASRGSRFHLPFSPHRNPIAPRGTTTCPFPSSMASGFHSGLLDSPPSPSRSEARSSRSGTKCPSRSTRRTSIGMSVYRRQ